MAVATYFRNIIANLMLGKAAAATPTIYVALYTVLPTDGQAATLNEVAYTGYARVAVGTGSPSLFGAAAGGTITNTAQINFPAISGTAPGPIVAAALVDTASGAGDIIDFFPLTSPVTYLQTQAPNFPAGSLSFTIAA